MVPSGFFLAFSLFPFPVAFTSQTTGPPLLNIQSGARRVQYSAALATGPRRKRRRRGSRRRAASRDGRTCLRPASRPALPVPETYAYGEVTLNADSSSGQVFVRDLWPWRVASRYRWKSPAASGWYSTLPIRIRRVRSGSRQSKASPSRQPRIAVPTPAQTDSLPAPSSASSG